MRRLQVLPCPESWDRMRPDQDGRYCERCELRVTEVAKLDDAGLEQLIASAETKRVCARFELDGGRPRLALRLAAGLVVIALAGCATPGAPVLEIPADQRAAWVEFMNDGSGSDSEKSGGVIAGAVRTPEGFPLAGAIVVLLSSALEAEQERVTNERGFYKFEDLPPGNYTIQVLYAKANVSKIAELPENSRFRANFMINPDGSQQVLLGVLTERSMIDTTSPASTYSSRMLEY